MNGFLNRPSVNSETALLSVEVKVVSEPIDVMDVRDQDEIEFLLFKSDDEESWNEFLLFKNSEDEESCNEESETSFPDSSPLVSSDGPWTSIGGISCAHVLPKESHLEFARVFLRFKTGIPCFPVYDTDLPRRGETRSACAPASALSIRSALTTDVISGRFSWSGSQQLEMISRTAVEGIDDRDGL